MPNNSSMKNNTDNKIEQVGMIRFILGFFVYLYRVAIKP
ncbi:Uncharacterised protein [Sphingobacterium spiritivorum]|uniref:Uncharacterized protein n=1 Tax=Sphingobacterium spiritivorum TaxID=258 RepID=A0A380B9E5_SPHSI|nr:Uncharacterised protein [Sphingobacterium spiritivorum]